MNARRLISATLLGAAAALCPAQALYQTNSAVSSLVVDGVTGTFIQKALVRSRPGTVIPIAISSSLAAPVFDLALADAPLVSSQEGAFVSGAGQIVNLQAASPGFRWLFGHLGFEGVTLPGPIVVPGTVAANAASSQYASSGQMLVLDPASADGSRLSQPVEIRTGISIELALGDDTGVLVQLQQLAPCAPSSINVLGTPRTFFSVVSNGRVVFGGVDTNPAPSVAAAMAGSAFFGAWCDLDPSAGGAVRLVSETPDEIAIEYSNVRYFGLGGLEASFRLTLTASGEMAIDGVESILPAPLPQFLGFSAGSAAQANPGPTTFTFTQSPVSCGADLVYDLGPAGTLATGLSRLVFVPSPAGGLTWAGY